MTPVLIDGQWRASAGSEFFQATDPSTRTSLPDSFPVSPWEEVELCLQSAQRAFHEVRNWNGERFASFLERYTEEILSRQADLVQAAHQETALPVTPRLQDVEIPRTVNQLRQAAQAARDGSWSIPTLDRQANIRSQHRAIGPVVIFGPNNFPFAFNSISGGDFAAAVAAGNPVIAKGHPAHPRTTFLLAEAAHVAAEATGMPAGFVQLIYHLDAEEGIKLVSHPQVGAVAYTGSRHAGVRLKEAADSVGKPIFLELSSVNPVFILPGALQERKDAILDEFVTSSLMGTGQFCTNPGLVVLVKNADSEQFVSTVSERFQAAPVGTLLNEGVAQHLRAGIVTLQRAGAVVLAGNQPADNGRCCHANTLLQVSADQFLSDPISLQTEVFGNCSLIVLADNTDQLSLIAQQLEGNLTGCVYSATTGEDDAVYLEVEAALRPRVGRLINDKMPTGVAVSAAMVHGGPFPASGHPGFTAVGIPAALKRFTALQCYDNVREHRLPELLKDQISQQQVWRLVDGQWMQGSV